MKSSELKYKVDALSEPFVSWDDTISEAENKVAKLEREGEAKRRVGFEGVACSFLFSQDISNSNSRLREWIIRITNHGKIRAWVAFALEFFNVFNVTRTLTRS